MMNLTEVFLNSAPVRERLPFGVNDNVFLRAVSTEPRKDKDGNRIKKNCYMTFSKVNPEEDNKIIAEYTFGYFELTKEEYAASNLSEQASQLISLLKVLVPADKLAKKVDTIVACLSDEAVGKALLAKSKKVKSLKPLQDAQLAMFKAFEKAVSKYAGNNELLFQLLVVTSKNGKFLDLPSEAKFVDTMEKASLTVPGKYKRWYLDGLKEETAEADDIGDDTTIVDDDDILGDDEDDDLGDI